MFMHKGLSIGILPYELTLYFIKNNYYTVNILCGTHRFHQFKPSLIGNFSHQFLIHSYHIFMVDSIIVFILFWHTVDWHLILLWKYCKILFCPYTNSNKIGPLCKKKTLLCHLRAKIFFKWHSLPRALGFDFSNFSLEWC